MTRKQFRGKCMYYGLQRNEVNTLCSLAKNGKSYKEIWDSVYPSLVFRKFSSQITLAFDKVKDSVWMLARHLADWYVSVPIEIRDSLSKQIEED